jgi:hypothetical protein
MKSVTFLGGNLECGEGGSAYAKNDASQRLSSRLVFLAVSANLKERSPLVIPRGKIFMEND